MDDTVHTISMNTYINNNHCLLSFKVIGKLKHSDYEQLFKVLEDLQELDVDKINVNIDITELSGIEVRAMWDDFIVGIKYNDKFFKIGVVCNHKWEEYVIKAANHFVDYEIKSFEDNKTSLDWLKEGI